MKRILSFFILTISIYGFAQKPCEFSSNVTDSLGTYKSTSDYLVSEKNFAGNSSYVYFSLVSTDGTPMLNVQFINKSRDFIKANCIDKNSRIYFQMNNGKIVTLQAIDQENCGAMVRNPEGFNNRILSGFFMFRKDSFNELKTSGISMMRVKYATETVDYVIRQEFVSELDGKTYRPENYFLDLLHCLEIN